MWWLNTFFDIERGRSWDVTAWRIIIRFYPFLFLCLQSGRENTEVEMAFFLKPRPCTWDLALDYHTAKQFEGNQMWLERDKVPSLGQDVQWSWRFSTFTFCLPRASVSNLHLFALPSPISAGYISSISSFRLFTLISPASPFLALSLWKVTSEGVSGVCVL